MLIGVLQCNTKLTVYIIYSIEMTYLAINLRHLQRWRGEIRRVEFGQL